MSTFLSITMLTPETRVYLEPPLTGVKEIQLLDCHIPKPWIKFKETQKVYKFSSQENAVEKIFFTIPPGNYTLKTLQQIFIRDRESSKLTILMTEQGYYLYSNKTINLRLSEKLSKKLGVPEKILPNQYYPIRWIAAKPLNVFCDLIESKSSYSNRIPRGENVEVSPSQLLAVMPFNNYPCLRVQQQDANPINYFTLIILDEKGRKPNFNNEPIRIHLKLSH